MILKLEVDAPVLVVIHAAVLVVVIVVVLDLAVPAVRKAVVVLHQSVLSANPNRNHAAEAALAVQMAGMFSVS